VYLYNAVSYSISCVNAVPDYDIKVLYVKLLRGGSSQ
jgi:hypothetical protein